MGFGSELVFVSGLGRIELDQSVSRLRMDFGVGAVGRSWLWGWFAGEKISAKK